MIAFANASATAVSLVTTSPTTTPDYIDYNSTDDGYDQVCLDLGSGDAVKWVREIVRLLLSAAILLSNSFIVAAVLRAWKREGSPVGTRAASSFLIFNLAAADALFGLTMLCGWMQDVMCYYFYDHMTRHPFTCMLGHVTTQFFDSTSCVTIVAIAVNSALSVSHEARCRNFLDKRRALIVITLTWFIGLFLALTVFMFPNAYSWEEGRGCQQSEIYEEVTLWCTVTILLTALFCCYWRIHRVTLEIVQRGAQPGAPRRHASTKAARMLLLIFAWDSCAYFPLAIVSLVAAVGARVSDTLSEVASNLTLLTFLADPYIYAYNNQQTKKAIVDFVACMKRESPQGGMIHEEPPSHRRASCCAQDSFQRVRQIISTITNSSSTGDEEKTNKQSPTIKRKSLGP